MKATSFTIAPPTSTVQNVGHTLHISNAINNRKAASDIQLPPTSISLFSICISQELTRFLKEKKSLVTSSNPTAASRILPLWTFQDTF